MSVIIATFLALLCISAIAAFLTSNQKRLRLLLKLHLAVAALITFLFFFVAARLAVPFPDSGPVPSGHILEGVAAMFRVSQLFVGTLAIIAISSCLIALRLTKGNGHVA